MKFYMKEKYLGNKIRIIFFNLYYKMINLGYLKKKFIWFKLEVRVKENERGKNFRFIK